MSLHVNIVETTNSAPYGGLLSSNCGGMQPLAAPEGPFGPKGDFARRMDEQTNKRTDIGFKGVR